MCYNFVKCHVVINEFKYNMFYIKIVCTSLVIFNSLNKIKIVSIVNQ